MGPILSDGPGEQSYVVDTNEAETALFPERVGDRLRAARTKAGLDLSDIASRTRIPLRHLQAIEAGDYSSFPSSTYVVGFVKAYARTVGEDEVELARNLRSELGNDAYSYNRELQDYEDADPARIPSRTLAWTAAAIALLLAIGYGIWRSQMLSGPEPGYEQASEAPKSVEVPSAPVATAPGNGGQVVLTATAPVWIRVYDAADKVLFEKEMAQGETFTVPADANDPKIRTGRAELIAVTIDGKPVAPLGPPERTVKDVGISAAALIGRPPATAASPATATTTAPPPATRTPAPRAQETTPAPVVSQPQNSTAPAPSPAGATTPPTQP